MHHRPTLCIIRATDSRRFGVASKYTRWVIIAEA
jgi:hypothetical protein